MVRIVSGSLQRLSKCLAIIVVATIAMVVIFSFVIIDFWTKRIA